METPPFMKSWVDVSKLTLPSSPANASHAKSEDFINIPEDGIEEAISVVSDINKRTEQLLREAIENIPPTLIEDSEKFHNLCKESLRESKNSSVRVSRTSSNINSICCTPPSPPSPPNSPNNGISPVQLTDVSQRVYFLNSHDPHMESLPPKIQNTFKSCRTVPNLEDEVDDEYPPHPLDNTYIDSYTSYDSRPFQMPPSEYEFRPLETRDKKILKHWCQVYKEELTKKVPSSILLAVAFFAIGFYLGRKSMPVCNHRLPFYCSI